MKILFVIHNFLPYSSTGVENYTFTLAKSLKRDHSVLIYSAIFDPLREKYSSFKYNYNKINVEAFYHDSVSKIFSDITSNTLLDRRFEELISSFKPDIVHFQHLMFHSTGYAEILKNKGIPSVLTVHDFYYYCPDLGQKLFLGRFPCYNKSPIKCALCFRTSRINISQIDKIVYKRASKSSILSNIGEKIPYMTYIVKGLRLFQSRPIPEDIIKREIEMLNFLKSQNAILSPSLYYRDFYGRFTGHNNIIHLDYGFEIPREKRILREKRDRLILGFVGTISRHKGAHLIIEVAKRFKDLIKILVWGNDRNDRILSKRLKSLKNVEYKGEFEHNRKEEAYKNIDYLIVPSIWEENSPLVIHESLLYNTPVIASNLGGNRELIIEGNNGFLFDPSKKNSLLDLIEKIIKENIRIENVDSSMVMDINTHTRRIEGIYNDIIKGRHS